VLKIKEGVDLKELEKFGYEYEELYSGYVKYINTGFHIIYIIVFENNRNYEKGTIKGNSNKAIDCIFKDDRLLGLCDDLVKANLIEQVGDSDDREI
jgi:hypothetical protein